jgi:hypothetical protein
MARPKHANYLILTSRLVLSLRAIAWEAVNTMNAAKSNDFLRKHIFISDQRRKLIGPILLSMRWATDPVQPIYR